jgi:restriction endonuclease Mrr
VSWPHVSLLRVAEEWSAERAKRYRASVEAAAAKQQYLAPPSAAAERAKRYRDSVAKQQYHAPGGAVPARAEQKAALAPDWERIDQMSGVEFEEYVAARLRRSGWDVSPTSATGDYGVDLIAKRDGQCFAVQCKRRGKPVGVSAVQEVVSGARRHKCTASMVVSNQEFTRAAKELAEIHDCKLIGRSTLPII